MDDYGDMDPEVYPGHIFELSGLMWRHRLRDRRTWHVRFLIRI